MRSDNYGLLQLYYGNGKGKTSAAVGQAVRAAGNGFAVFFMQLLKDSSKSGELKILSTIKNVTCEVFGTGEFLSLRSLTDKDRLFANQAMARIESLILNRSHDILIIDEIGAAIELGLVDKSTLRDLLKKASGWLDVVLTGHSFPEEIMDLAATVTRLKAVRHHYDSGIPARRGIEY